MPVERNTGQNQQISTTIRTYYEVDRDDGGEYILPVEIDSWTVVDLGKVVWDRPAYHNQRYIYPVNYTVRKWYRSMVDPKSDTQYTCCILDNGREPKFEVTADDCPMTYSGPTPTTVWTIIVRRAFAIRNQEYGHNPVGPDFFGLRKNTIAKMIQDLPNASKCSQYVWQTFEPARFNKPGRNRRRTDSTLSSGLYGGVNYSLTSNRVLPPSLTPNTSLPTSESPRIPHRKSQTPVEETHSESGHISKHKMSSSPPSPHRPSLPHSMPQIESA
ncbi:F/Y-rich N-terminus-domain-containing protein [Phycomyces nitens]|nr:F/Y-rich N-terminus-domain-containing protein [Phycomyces nitens]